MKINKKIMAIGFELNISMPKGWNELSTTQLYYVYGLIADSLSIDQIKTYCFFSWAKLTIRHRVFDRYVIRKDGVDYMVDVDIIVSAVNSLNWLADLPDYPICIPKINGNNAFDVSFRGVEFEKYIICDNYYQGYLHTQNPALLQSLAEVLYNKEGIKINQIERMSIFYWIASVKKYLSNTFPNFLQPADSSNENMMMAGNNAQRINDAVNAQIRALTKGDVTKEKEILSLDTWRALTELDAIVYDNEQLKMSTKK